MLMFDMLDLDMELEKILWPEFAPEYEGIKFICSETDFVTEYLWDVQYLRYPSGTRQTPHFIILFIYLNASRGSV